MNERTPQFQHIMQRIVLKEKAMNSASSVNNTSKTASTTKMPVAATSANKSKLSAPTTTTTTSAAAMKKKDTENAFKPKVTNSYHASSHANANAMHMNTPVNRKPFGSHLNGSSNKMDSDRKRVPGSAKQSDSLAMSLFKSNMLTPVNKLVCTPVVPSSIGKNGKSFDVNPIWNGVDYTAMILKKPEYGYTGPGYIVEFDCDPKYLKQLRIERGLWRIISQKNGSSTPFDLGPFLISQRIDEEKKTPAKTPVIAPFEFKSYHFDSADKSATIANLNLDVCSNKKDEIKKPIIKKSLRWAENLENVAADSSTTMMTTTTAATTKTGLSMLENSPGLAPLIEKDFDDEERPPSRKMRRSYSTSDMNKYLLSGHANEDSVNQDSLMTADRSGDNSTMIIPSIEIYKPINQSHEMVHLNETYDKPLSVAAATCNGISPSRVVNSSFMDGSSIIAGSTCSTGIQFNFGDKLRQIMSISSPSQTTSAFQSSMNSSSSQSVDFYESAMIKSMQAMKNVMFNRYKLDPNRASSASMPRLIVTSHQNYQELLNLADYLDWLSKYLKNNLVYESC